MAWAKKYRQPCFRIFGPPELFKELKETAERLGTTQQHMMRSAIEMLLRNVNGPQRPLPTAEVNQLPLDLPTPRPPVPKAPT